MCFCKGKKARDIQGSVSIYFCLSIDRILCSLLSQWNISCFFFFSTTRINKNTTSQNNWSLPTKRESFGVFSPLSKHDTRVLYSHALFKQFKSILFSRTNFSQNLDLSFLTHHFEVFVWIYIYMYIHTNTWF